jgi:long-chain acyl-CoA synthetase
MDPLENISDILHRFSKSPSNEKAFAYHKNGNWQYLSSDEFIEYVQCAALGLRAIGLRKGDRVGIFSKSSPYWLIADFAIAIAGGVTVPFFANLSEEHFVYEVGVAKPRFIFVGEDESYDMVGPHTHLFEGVIKVEDDAEFKADFNLWDIIQKGKEIHERSPHLYEEMENGIHSDDLATIIFTSGSTGEPKGVELTHKNLVYIIHYEEFEWKEGERFLSILPLPHIFSKQINYIMVAWGIQSYYLNDLTIVGDICKEIHPTFMIVVPRLMEKIYSKMLTKIQNAGLMKRAFGLWAFDLANREGGLYKWLMQPIADRLVYSQLRQALGGKLRLVISGGAALNPQLHHFFLDIGVPIVQGWGLTEASTIAVNRWGKQKVGTCGPPLPGIQFKISSKGEVLVKGPTVMRGYYQNPEATALAIDKDGWLHTGDFGSLDGDGYLTIGGRMNESFKTGQGEYVVPVPIEQKISQAPLIDMAMVIGENQPHASVLLFPDKNVLQNLKQLHNKVDLSDEEFLKSRFVIAEMEELLKELNSELNHWERIHDYRFILETPTIEGGELTPTMKLRRKKILEKYQNIVSDIYSREAA